MLPNLAHALAWLKAHPEAVQSLRRGLERETLRFNTNNYLSKDDHPHELGSPLTHSWITTDFSENLMEFVTPVKDNAEQLVDFLGDLHKFTYQYLGNDHLWPMSMPCFIGDESNIRLAQYGPSNVGRYKTLYREGLKNRYGSLMQTIAGIHYNFSFSDNYWVQRFPNLNESERSVMQSKRYLNLIRNYLRYGWVIPYLFGASPAICKCFLQGEQSPHNFVEEDEFYYLPYATSLRLSDLGYTTDTQQNLGITYNDLQEYCDALYKACHQPWAAFADIDKKAEKVGHPLQLNSNILQFEAEFYSWIRPKQITKGDERVTSALSKRGIQYVEARVLDVNPYAEVGITTEQIHFLDLFMIWCELAEAPEMSEKEQQCCQHNWGRVILEGRKPNQTISCGGQKESLQFTGEKVFSDLLQVADVLDSTHAGKPYRKVCEELLPKFANPEQTLSARVLNDCLTSGLGHFAKMQALEFKQQIIERGYQILNEKELKAEVIQSRHKTAQIEESDAVSFTDYLTIKNGI